MAMLKSSPAFLVLALVLFWCFSTSTGSYQYFQFVQQWPPTTCAISKKPCYQNPPSIFTIHGLWPSNYSKNAWVANCSPTRFNNSLSPRLETKLKISWPDVESGNYTDFWEREWNKHGTCSEQTLDQEQYFERSHDIWNAYNITNILKRAKILPTGGKWDYSDIVSPIKTAIRKMPALRCKPDPTLPKNHNISHQLLHEVVLCLHYNGRALIDCNNPSCKNNLKILFQ
uniref:S-locus associated ribonuclease n=1 Tax=Prunus speciosa TaxID=378228 RepID=G3C8T8_9ROSA|nr:S-locus associated ribonuclease [Prunus speciosa]